MRGRTPKIPQFSGFTGFVRYPKSLRSNANVEILTLSSCFQLVRGKLKSRRNPNYLDTAGYLADIVSQFERHRSPNSTTGKFQ